MEQIKSLKSVLKQAEEQFASDEQTRSFEKSMSEFNELVNSGIIKPRGYNILSVENSYLTTQLN